MNKELVKLSCRKDLEDYCIENNISIKKFNRNIKILPNASCTGIREGCEEFNQPFYTLLELSRKIARENKPTYTF